MSRAPRIAAAGLLLALALPALTACRSAPDVAAYVGDAQVTVAELEQAVDERLADPGVATFASADRAAYDRRVLGFLIEREVYEQVAERYDVSVDDAAARARIEELSGENDAEEAYAQLAAQGVGRTDVVETIRQQLVQQEVAEAEGLADADESTLQELYGELREEYVQLEFGYLTVPDEATATAVLAELTADPAGYAAVAARYPGESTLPELARRSADQLPPVLREELTAAEPGTGFSVVVEGLGTVVGFVTGEVYPSFEELRDEVEAVAAERVQAAGAEVVEEVRDELDVTVNPRFGVLTDEGRLAPNEGGVVQILAARPDVQPAVPGD